MDTKYPGYVVPWVARNEVARNEVRLEVCTAKQFLVMFSYLTNTL